MASNSFGKIFKITTWGESHGKAIGVVVDGCPAGVAIDEGLLQTALDKRAPGANSFTSPRKETDQPEILSGVFEGRTTGAPICILIQNKDSDPSKYEPIKDLLRPGHANFTYLEKYGIFDHRGAGRASGRETASRVAAGAIAKKFLEESGIQVSAYIKQIGTIKADITSYEDIDQSPIFCPDPTAAKAMMALIEQLKVEGDSIGGLVEFVAKGVPASLGDPVYEKISAKLAHAMMSIPASKGFEMGSGFEAVTMKGSEHNDLFSFHLKKLETETNHAGGVLGGISNGMPIIGRVAFKPASSIKHLQKTFTTSNQPALFQLPEGSRHDPCVAIRAVPVVEAMLALVLIDAILINRSAKR